MVQYGEFIQALQTTMPDVLQEANLRRTEEVVSEVLDPVKRSGTGQPTGPSAPGILSEPVNITMSSMGNGQQESTRTFGNAVEPINITLSSANIIEDEITRITRDEVPSQERVAQE